MKEQISSSLTSDYNILLAASQLYDLIFAINFTTKQFKIVDHYANENQYFPSSGTHDELMEKLVAFVSPECKSYFLKRFDCKTIIENYQNKKEISFDYKVKTDNDVYSWVRSHIIFLHGAQKEVIGVCFIENIDLEKKLVERTKIQDKILEVITSDKYEYVAVINRNTKYYYIYNKNPNCCGSVAISGDYDSSVENVSHQMEDSKRKKFIEEACLEKIVESLEDDDVYSYRYTTSLNGIKQTKEARTSWLDREKKYVFLVIENIDNLNNSDNTKSNENKTISCREECHGIIFEYDRDSKFLFLAGEIYASLGRNIIVNNFPYGEIEQGNIYEDDIPNVLKTTDVILNGDADVIDVEFRIKNARGQYIWLCARMEAVYDNNNNTRFLGQFFNIDSTKKKSHNQKILTQRDSLTGLLNARAVEKMVDNYLLTKKSTETNCLYTIDIDNFESINDRYGVKTGDGVIVYIASLLQGLFRATDIVARLAGDVFVVFVKANLDEQSAIQRAKNVCSIINTPITMENGTSIAVSCSIGMAFALKDGNTYKELYHKAYQALCEAKRRGKNSVIVFDKNSNAQYQEKKTNNDLNFVEYNFITGKISEQDRKLINLLSSDDGEKIIQKALANNEFVCYFQPQKDLKTNQYVSVEILARWNSPKYGLVSPGIFIPILERKASIDYVDSFMLEEAFKILRKWQTEGINFSLSVNQSRHFIVSDNYIDIIKRNLKKYKIDPSKLLLEVTESCIWDNNDLMTQKIKELKEIGFLIAIDDFGNGYTSLGMLIKTEVDQVKLDKTFFVGTDLKKNLAVIKGVVGLCKEIGASVVIEGIETAQQEEMANIANVDIAQGYLYSQPICYDDFTKHLQKIRR